MNKYSIKAFIEETAQDESKNEFSNWKALTCLS